jgi:hypothetical protein
MPGQEQQQARPAPPPGYFDVEASGTKPPPPAGYHDVEAAPQQPEQQGFLSKLWQGANTPIGTLAEKAGAAPGTGQAATEMGIPPLALLNAVKSLMDRGQQKATVSGSPALAGAAAGIGGAAGTAGKIITSMTSPLGIATAAGGPLAKLAAPLFMGSGIKEAMTPQQPGEDQASSLERRLLGGATAAGGAAGTASTYKGMASNVGEGIRSTVAEKTGIQDLAPKIAQRGKLAADAVNSAKTAENAAHEAASAPYKALAAKITETIPPEQIRGDVSDIVGGVIEGDKIPGAIKDMMDAGSSKGSSTVRALTNSEMQSADVIKKTVLDKGGTIKQARETAANLGYAPRQIDAMMSIMGEGGSEGVGFEQLKQMKSRLGREMGTYQGPAKAAASQLLDYIGQNMRKLAEGADSLKEYKEAESGYREFMKDWHNGHPIEKLLNGKDTSKIIDSFTGDTGKRVVDTLRKYGADVSPFQKLHGAGLIDEPFKGAEAKSGLMSEKAMAKARLKDVSQQGVMRGVKSPWTLGSLALGLVNPSHLPIAAAYAGARVGLPKLLGSDLVGDWLTKGMSEDLPKIPPKKVLPKPPEK